MMDTNEQRAEALKNAVILIPSLEPDERLPSYIQKLGENGFGHIVVVDDGSAESYQPIFERIAAMPDTAVVHHDVNHGKGVALKTGYTYIMENIPDCSGVITADADGQHTVEDCIRLAEKLATGERALYLGSRDFGEKQVPFKSRAGNRITSAVFKLLYGKWLPDTQTGLRAFRREDLQFMTEVEGERFEYEMNVLISCARAKLPMIPVTIATVYENDNAGTHFNTLRDSYRIYKVILGNFVKFCGTSILCFLIDQGLFNLFRLIFKGGEKVILGATIDTGIWISTVLARIISATVNFLLNKNVVFKQKGKTAGSLWKYAVLAVGIVILSALGTQLLTRIGVATWLAKPIVDIVLYFVSYYFQQNWVFGKGEAKE